MEETKYYTCHYCREQYIPKRRGVQRFCKAGCRVRSHQLNNSEQQNAKRLNQKGDDNSSHKTKIEEVSLAGVGNAAVGTLVADGSIYLTKKFLAPNLLPATKDDIEKLNARLERFQEIKNAENDVLGRKPYYDNIEKIIVCK
tara:strand:+ start:17702 stop:18127 length:426 start_codon:yes stop_codon:yes gene_type:complete